MLQDNAPDFSIEIVDAATARIVSRKTDITYCWIVVVGLYVKRSGVLLPYHQARMSLN